MVEATPTKNDEKTNLIATVPAIHRKRSLLYNLDNIFWNYRYLFIISIKFSYRQSLHTSPNRLPSPGLATFVWVDACAPRLPAQVVFVTARQEQIKGWHRNCDAFLPSLAPDHLRRQSHPLSAKLPSVPFNKLRTKNTPLVYRLT